MGRDRACTHRACRASAAVHGYFRVVAERAPVRRNARSVAVDAVAEHNQRMWERLAKAGIPYTRPQGRPPSERGAKRRFLDELTYGRIQDIPLEGRRVLSLAGGGRWAPILFEALGPAT